MRFYDLTITPSGATKPIIHYTSHPNGINQPPDPGALNIEFDIMVSTFGQPSASGGSVITVHGVPNAVLNQATSFAGMDIVLKGGMGKGLPFANPKQSGILLSGSVFQSFGNWVGLDRTIDFVVYGTTTYTLDQPGNFSVNWPAGQPINVGIAQVLNTTFPGVKQNFLIQSGIVFPNAEANVCSTLRGFADYVFGLTEGYGNDSYAGVNIAMQAGQFFIYDGTQTSATVQLTVPDLVGQPQWIDQNTMQVQTVLRGDVQIANTLKMPAGLQNLPGIVATSASSLPSTNQYKTAFQGSFIVAPPLGQGIRHIGNFTDPDGSQWSSVFNCVVPLAS